MIEPLDRGLLYVHGCGRCPVYHVVERRDVVAAPDLIRQREQAVEHGRDEMCVRDLVTLDQTKCLLGIPAVHQDDGVADAVMQILIQVRQHVRGKKDFETADMIRDLLKERNITVEDRPDGTIWRLE